MALAPVCCRTRPQNEPEPPRVCEQPNVTDRRTHPDTMNDGYMQDCGMDVIDGFKHYYANHLPTFFKRARLEKRRANHYSRGSFALKVQVLDIFVHQSCKTPHACSFWQNLISCPRVLLLRRLAFHPPLPCFPRPFGNPPSQQRPSRKCA